LAVAEKSSGILVEYLANGRLYAGAAMREQGDKVVVMDASGNEQKISRDLILVRYADRPVTRENIGVALSALKAEHESLGHELDLNLLWEIVRDDDQGHSAAELAETFFGRVSSVETAVMLDALLNDRLYFVRRHMEFVPRDPEQVERLRTQYERIHLRSESGRNTRRILSTILEGGPIPAREELGSIPDELTRFLENPFARSRETAALLEAIAGELTVGEAAYEILERIGNPPPGPRYALIGGLRMKFSEAVLNEVSAVAPPIRSRGGEHPTFTIDDEDTVEIDDALGCERLANGNYRVRVHIALVADFVRKGSHLDNEAAIRGTTVYLPEARVRMLPDELSTDAASLIAGQDRHVLTTDAEISPAGELIRYSIYPEKIRVSARLTYDEADRLLAAEPNGKNQGDLLKMMNEVADLLRERRVRNGARIVHRREAKVTVSGDDIEIEVIEGSSPSRELVAEFMILSNYAAARSAADRRIPMIYRVQPNAGEDVFVQRARLSIHPEFHSGVGLECYVQASSPIRRYVDLVMQRQLLATLGEESIGTYDAEQMLNVLAAAESVEADGRELERRAKRYWTLTYLQRQMISRELRASIGRDSTSAELDDYAVRGSLRGAPNLSSNARIMVQLAKVEPTRGTLALRYIRTIPEAEEGAALPLTRHE
jgi:exoribonuclease-2